MSKQHVNKDPPASRKQKVYEVSHEIRNGQISPKKIQKMESESTFGDKVASGISFSP